LLLRNAQRAQFGLRNIEPIGEELGGFIGDALAIDSW
jgi:hypothetical protein